MPLPLEAMRTVPGFRPYAEALRRTQLAQSDWFPEHRALLERFAAAGIPADQASVGTVPTVNRAAADSQEARWAAWWEALQSAAAPRLAAQRSAVDAAAIYAQERQHRLDRIRQTVYDREQAEKLAAGGRGGGGGRGGRGGGGGGGSAAGVIGGTWEPPPPVFGDLLNLPALNPRASRRGTIPGNVSAAEAESEREARRIAPPRLKAPSPAGPRRTTPGPRNTRRYY